MVCNFIEVCAGCGGLSSGLIKAGLHPLLLNDNNKDCCKTLQLNHDNVDILCDNMKNVNISKYIGIVDLFTGGVPCQSFSQSGLRKGLNDSRGELLVNFIEMVFQIKPKIFMIENVKGLVTHDKGNTIQKIISDLSADNLYEVKYRVLNANQYQVPQKRERVFIVGTLKSLGIKYEFPKALNERKVLKDALINVPQSIGAKYPEHKKQLFKHIPPGGCWINLPDDLQKEYLGKSYFSGGGKRGILHRLSMEKPSLTLLCTPSQKQTERCHPSEDRPLTIREYARIQTFEDDYKFFGSISSQYKQIGNAIPVNLAYHMGLSILNCLDSAT